MIAALSKAGTKAAKMTIAALLCLTCAAAFALASTNQAQADETQTEETYLYPVVYQAAGEEGYTLVYQDSPNPVPSLGTFKASYEPKTKPADIDIRYPLLHVIAEPGVKLQGTFPDNVRPAFSTVFSISDDWAYGAFEGCEDLITVDLSGISWSASTLDKMFYECSSLKSVNLGSTSANHWSRTDSMFSGCTSLTSINLPEGPDASSLYSIESMFSGCTSLTSVDFSKINAPNVEHARALFGGCEALKSVKLDGLRGAHPIDMRYMFFRCKNLTSLESMDLKSLSFSAKGVEIDSMFAESGLTSADLTGFDLSRVRSALELFAGCSSLKSVNMKGLDLSRLECMERMFVGSTAATVDLSDINIPRVSSMDRLFQNASVTAVDFSGLNAPCLNDMNQMFQFSSVVTVDFSGLNAPCLSTMEYMFADCYKLKNVKFTGAKTPGLTCTAFMFLMSGIEHVGPGCAVDLTGLDMSHVTDMYSMFQGCGFTDNPELEGAENMAEAEKYRNKSGVLTTLDLRGLNLSSVENIDCAFSNCYWLETVDLSTVDTRTVKGNPSSVFWVDHSLKTVKLSANTQLGQYLWHPAWRNSSGKIFQTEQIPSFKADTYYAIATTALSKASVTVKSRVFADKKLGPTSITVKLNGQKLKKGRDYTVTCKKGKYVGSYSVTIKGKGIYTGKKKATFKIVPKAVSGVKAKGAKKVLKVSWKKPSASARSQITGFQVRYSTNKSMKGAKTVKVKGASKTSASIKKLKGGKKYYVQVRAYKTVKGKTYHSSWSAVKSAKTK